MSHDPHPMRTHSRFLRLFVGYKNRLGRCVLPDTFRIYRFTLDAGVSRARFHAAESGASGQCLPKSISGDPKRCWTSVPVIKKILDDFLSYTCGLTVRRSTD